MSVIVSSGSTSINTTNGFLKSNAYNVGVASTTGLAVTTARNISLTFANSGSCLGVVFGVRATESTYTTIPNNRSVIVKLQEAFSPVTFDTSLDTITFTSHSLSNDQSVMFLSTGTLPTGITSGNTYYIINSTTNDFQISSTVNGSLIDLSGTPSGTATCWVNRASSSLSASQINPELVATGSNNTGTFFTPFEFSPGYTVTTSSNKWQLNVIQSGGSVGTWSLITSDATNPFYVTWSDFPVSFTDNDCLICKDTVIIDKTATIQGILGTGETSQAVACVVCRGTNLSKPNISLLKWENPPSSSYTFNVDGLIIIAAFSGIEIGRSGSAIPAVNKAIVNFKAATNGTVRSGIFPPFSVSSGAQARGKTAFFVYGEVPATPFGILSSSALVGSTYIHLTETPSNWNTDDYIFIGKQNTQGQGSGTRYQIASVTGSDSGSIIGLKTAIATNNRMEGGTVINFEGYGVILQASSSAVYATDYVINPSYFELVGCRVYDRQFSLHGVTSYYNYPASASNRSQYYIDKNLFWSDTTSDTNTFASFIIPPEGGLFTNNLSVNKTPIYYLNAYYVAQMKSGTLYFHNNRILSMEANANFTAGTYTYKLDAQNNVFENCDTDVPAILLHGLKPVLRNNVFYGCGGAMASGGTLYLGQSVQARLGNNVFDNCACALVFGGYTTLNAIDEGSSFGVSGSNTVDIGFYSVNYVDYTLKSPKGNLIIDESVLPDLTDGTNIRIVNFNDIQNNDCGYLPTGKFQRCGDGLTDTTSRISGSNKFSLRFQPTDSTLVLNWSQDVPIGNIQNKTMTISVWVKINSSTYYAGTHTNPTLSVTYDEDVTVTDTATNSTEWQLLAITFTPTTTYGQVTVDIYGSTDALTTDAYFYVDDMNVAYPAGVQIDLGGLDIWANALPVVPSIATFPSLGGVWDEPVSSHVIAGTFGDIAKRTEIKVDDNTALILSK